MKRISTARRAGTAAQNSREPPASGTLRPSARSGLRRSVWGARRAGGSFGGGRGKEAVRGSGGGQARWLPWPPQNQVNGITGV